MKVTDLIKMDGSWTDAAEESFRGRPDTTIGGLIDEGATVQDAIVGTPEWRSHVARRALELMGSMPPQHDWSGLDPHAGAPFHVDYDPRLAGPPVPLIPWNPSYGAPLPYTFKLPDPVAPSTEPIQDSGARTKFSTGSQRDTQQNKGRPSLIPTIVLRRLARWFGLGAFKYDDRNWELGQPLSQYYDSAMRHMQAAFDGATDEDHEAAWLWNSACFMWTRHMIEIGHLPAELDDRPRYGGNLLAEMDGYER